MENEMSQLATEIQSRKSVLSTVAIADREAFQDAIADLENRLQFLANIEAELERAEIESSTY